MEVDCTTEESSNGVPKKKSKKRTSSASREDDESPSKTQKSGMLLSYIHCLLLTFKLAKSLNQDIIMHLCLKNPVVIAKSTLGPKDKEEGKFVP